MISTAFAQSKSPAQGGAFGAASQFVPILLIFAVFYFLLIRPQQKQQKRLRQMIADVKRGDEVVMTGGIHGRVDEVGGTVVQLLVANGIKIQFDRSSIAQIKGYQKEAIRAKG